MEEVWRWIPNFIVLRLIPLCGMLVEHCRHTRNSEDLVSFPRKIFRLYDTSRNMLCNKAEYEQNTFSCKFKCLGSLRNINYIVKKLPGIKVPLFKCQKSACRWCWLIFTYSNGNNNKRHCSVWCLKVTSMAASWPFFILNVISCNIYFLCLFYARGTSRMNCCQKWRLWI